MLGRLRMNPQGMTMRQIENAMRGYWQEREEDAREDWERARMAAYFAAAPHLKKAKGMTDLIPMPWDAKQERIQLTPEQLEYLMRKMDNIPWES